MAMSSLTMEFFIFFNKMKICRFLIGVHLKSAEFMLLITAIDKLDLQVLLINNRARIF